MNSTAPVLNTAYPVENSDLTHLREMFALLTARMRSHLEQRFCSEYQIDVPELSDTAAALAMYNNTDASAAVLHQTFHLFSGWRKGAEVSMVWRASEPGIVRIKGRPFSRLESDLSYALTIGPGMLFAFLGMFSSRVRLLRMLIFGGLGFLGGLMVYGFFADPILRFVNREHLQTSGELAARAYRELSQIVAASVVERRDIDK
jgi:hypothetical protein